MRLCRRKRKWIGGTNLAVLKAKPINLIILQLLSKNSLGVRRQSSQETEAKNSAYVVAFMTTENVFNVAPATLELAKKNAWAKRQKPGSNTIL